LCLDFIAEIDKTVEGVDGRVGGAFKHCRTDFSEFFECSFEVIQIGGGLIELFTLIFLV